MTSGLRWALWALGAMLASGLARAEKFEITPFVGYQIGGTIDAREGDLEIDPSANWGLVVSFRTGPEGLVELLYSHQETSLETPGNFFEAGELVDLNVEYLHFGGMWEIKGDRTRPFIGMTLGAARLDPQGSGLDEEYLFSGAFSGGAKHFFTEAVGLRFEGRALLSVFGSSGGVFCGFPPGQCAATVSGSAILQLDILAGLIFRF